MEVGELLMRGRSIYHTGRFVTIYRIFMLCWHETCNCQNAIHEYRTLPELSYRPDRQGD